MSSWPTSRNYSSCIVERDQRLGLGERPEDEIKRKPTGHAAHLLKIVQNTLADLSVQAPRDLGLPFGTPVVTRDQVSAEALKAQFAGAEKEDKNAFRAQLSRALSSLSGDGLIGMRNDLDLDVGGEMTKSRKSAGCNKRNTSATLLMLRPVALRDATYGCESATRRIQEICGVQQTQH